MGREDHLRLSRGQAFRTHTVRPARGREALTSTATPREWTHYQSIAQSNPPSGPAAQPGPGRPHHISSSYGSEPILMPPSFPAATPPPPRPQTRLPLHTSAPHRAEVEMMPIPLPTARPSLPPSRVRQVPTMPWISPPGVLQAAVQGVRTPRHPVQAPARPLTSPSQSMFRDRAIKIGIETEFYLTARNKANSREKPEDFIEIITTNYNRQVSGYPSMRETLRQLEVDDHYYGKWCFVQDPTIGTYGEPCELLPFRLILRFRVKTS